MSLSLTKGGPVAQRVGALVLSLAAAFSPTTTFACAENGESPMAPWNSPAVTSVFGATTDVGIVVPSIAEVGAWLRAAREEAAIAQRVLSAIADDTAPECVRYLDALDEALCAVEDEITPRHARDLAGAFAQAREQLALDATVFSRWRRIQRAMDPSLPDALPVPPRFVRRAPEPLVAPEPIGGEADLRIDRIVREFWGSDGDPHLA